MTVDKKTLIACLSKQETIVLPNTIETIGKEAFEGAKEVLSVILPCGLKYIRRSVFSDFVIWRVQTQKHSSLQILSNIIGISTAFALKSVKNVEKHHSSVIFIANKGILSNNICIFTPFYLKM